MLSVVHLRCSKLIKLANFQVLLRGGSAYRDILKGEEARREDLDLDIDIEVRIKQE